MPALVPFRQPPAAISTEEMFTTGYDAANRATPAHLPAEELNLVGITVRGPKNGVGKIFRSAHLHTRDRLRACATFDGRSLGAATAVRACATFDGRGLGAATAVRACATFDGRSLGAATAVRACATFDGRSLGPRSRHATPETFVRMFGKLG